MAEEGPGGLLPPENAAPLVVEQGQVPPGVDDVAPVVAEQGLGGGADTQFLLQLLTAAQSDPGALGGEALHMVLLLLEQGLRDEHGHGHVGVAGLFELFIQITLNILPDGIAIGAVDEHTLHAAVIDELCLGTHVGEPLGKIHLHIGDLLHLFLVILCHDRFLPFQCNMVVQDTSALKVEVAGGQERPASWPLACGMVVS